MDKNFRFIQAEVRPKPPKYVSTINAIRGLLTAVMHSGLAMLKKSAFTIFIFRCNLQVTSSPMVSSYSTEKQSCIKYSTNKYQYQYQYLTFKYQYQYKYCA